MHYCISRWLQQNCCSLNEPLGRTVYFAKLRFFWAEHRVQLNGLLLRLCPPPWRIEKIFDRKKDDGQNFVVASLSPGKCKSCSTKRIQKRKIKIWQIPRLPQSKNSWLLDKKVATEMEFLLLPCKNIFMVAY